MVLQLMVHNKSKNCGRSQYIFLLKLCTHIRIVELFAIKDIIAFWNCGWHYIDFNNSFIAKYCTAVNLLGLLFPSRSNDRFFLGLKFQRRSPSLKISGYTLGETELSRNCILVKIKFIWNRHSGIWSKESNTFCSCHLDRAEM